MEEKTNERKALIRVNLVGDDLEWVTKQAMLKPIFGGMVNNCPLTNLSSPADLCEDNCKYFVEFRQPQMDPNKPNVVVCKGHHETAMPTDLFDFSNGAGGREGGIPVSSQIFERVHAR
jgi:hypothetical protein